MFCGRPLNPRCQRDIPHLLRNPPPPAFYRQIRMGGFFPYSSSANNPPKPLVFFYNLITNEFHSASTPPAFLQCFSAQKVFKGCRGLSLLLVRKF